MKAITTAVILFVLSLVVSLSATAQVLEVNIWKPIPGKSPLTYQYGMEAKVFRRNLALRSLWPLIETAACTMH